MVREKQTGFFHPDQVQPPQQSESPILEVAEQEREPVIESNLEQFIHQQDDPAWRQQVIDEWFEILLKSQYFEGLKSSIIQDVNSYYQMAVEKLLERDLPETQRKVYENRRDFYKQLLDGEYTTDEDKATVFAREFLKNELYRRVPVEESGMLVPFLSYLQFNRVEQDEALKFIYPSEMAIDSPNVWVYHPNFATIDEVTSMIEVDWDSVFLGFDSAVADKTPKKYAYGKEGKGKRVFVREEPYSVFSNKEEAIFVGETPHKNTDVLLKMRIHLFLGTYNWIPIKKVIEYFRQQGFSVLLKEKGGNACYAYHLVNNSSEK
ncbi:MAG: hypothetical protein HYV32_01045 [Candidatus Kerfeldbacteria bacterium]|nr:hypothetical protein [Candidatus Kerfeldbacteria bacterium]